MQKSIKASASTRAMRSQLFVRGGSERIDMIS
jgi:hypothetical protein